MKKKSFFALISAVLAAAVILSVFAVPSFARRKLGDIDGDGFVTSADARSALRASVKLDALTDEQAMAADVDGDTFVTSDLKHDLYLEARAQGINLLDAGHYSTEAVVCPVLVRWLAEKFPGLEVLQSRTQGEVFRYL